MIGPTTTMIHAPSVNFAMTKIEYDNRRDAGRKRVHEDATSPVGFFHAQVARDHARSGEGESGEDTDRVERDQGVDRRVEGDDQASETMPSTMMPLEKASR